MKRALFIFILATLFITLCSAHSWCGHDTIVREEAKKRTFTRKVRLAQQNTFNPIRILFYTDYVMNDAGRTCYSSTGTYRRGNPSSTSVTCSSTVTDNCYGQCDASLVVDSNKNDILNNQLIPMVQRKLQTLLSVKSVTGLLPITTNTCGAQGGVTVPASHKAPGVSGADIVIYVTMRPTESGVLAWAIECLSSASDNRPIAGQVNIGPNSFGNNQLSHIAGIVLHEVTHILGFSSNKYNEFIKSDGSPQSPVTSSTTRSYNGQSKTIQKIVTPQIVAVAKQHYQCSTADGVELEEYGGSGTAGSHFEKRQVMNDYMVGSASWYNPSETYSISSFSLALLEDSGWYRANYSAADPLIYGRNTGCNILNNRCSAWNLNNFEGYFCNDGNPQNAYCSFDLKAKGYCGLAKYQSPGLPAYYQYFSDPTVGGNDPYMDYCPVILRYSNGRCDGAGSASAKIGEVYGQSSACFDSALGNVLNPPATKDATCLQYRCALVNGGPTTTLQVGVDGNWYDCGSDGQVKRIDISGTVRGYVKCPNNGYQILCANVPGVVPSPSQPGGKDCGNGIFSFFCSDANKVGQVSVLMIALIGMILSFLL